MSVILRTADRKQDPNKTGSGLGDMILTSSALVAVLSMDVPAAPNFVIIVMGSQAGGLQ